MSTEPQRPASRITDALLPPTAPPRQTTHQQPGPATDHGHTRPETHPPSPPHPAPTPAPRPRPAAERPTPAPAPQPRPAAERPASTPPGPASQPRPTAERPAATPPAPAPAPQPRPTAERPASTPPAPASQPRPTPVRHQAQTPHQAQPPARPAAPPRPSGAPAGAPATAAAGGGAAAARVAAAPVAGHPLPAVETTTRLRPIRDAHPMPPHAPAPAYGVDRWALPDETPVETTTRLRPVQDRRPGRVLAAAGSAVLGLGLIGGALAGALLAGSGAGEPAEPPGYSPAKALWHDAPVDTLFPRTLSGPTAGPGGAARTWTRIVVAADAPCTAAAMPKGLLTALKVPGCERVLRATYTDATSSHVTTVALVFTQADPATMRTLGSRADDDPPPALAAPATVAAGFGDRQRASWWRHILPDLPVVVTSVSGFADGRTVAEAEPATRAMTAKRTTPVAQAGLGHEAKGVGDAVERALRKTVAATLKKADR